MTFIGYALACLIFWVGYSIYEQTDEKDDNNERIQ